MNSKNKVSVSQFFITLFLAGMFLLCGFFGVGTEKNNILINLIFSVIGIAVLILSCIPAYAIYKKTGKTLTQVISEKYNGFSVVVKIFYIICFVIFTCVFLVKFAKFLQTQINNNATPIAVVFIFLAIAAFGCFKGIQPLFRTSVIIFAFAIFSIAFIYIGLFSEVDFSNFTAGIIPLNEQIENGIETLLLSLLPVSAYVVFTDSLKGSHKKGIAFYGLFSFCLFFLMGLFIILVLGDYSGTIAYPSFILTKLSRISMLKGGDGLLFATLTAVTFLIAYLFFCCGSKTAGAYHSKTFSIGFAFTCFLLTIVMCYVPAVNDFISNSLFLSLLAVTAVLILPLLTLASIRRELK